MHDQEFNMFDEEKQRWHAELVGRGISCQNNMNDRPTLLYMNYIWTWSKMFQEWQKLCPVRLAELFQIVLPKED